MILEKKLDIALVLVTIAMVIANVYLIVTIIG
jgi:hypothetical protein